MNKLDWKYENIIKSYRIIYCLGKIRPSVLLLQLNWRSDTNGPHNVRLFSDPGQTKTLFVYRRPMPRVTAGRTQFNQLEGTFTKGHVRQFFRHLPNISLSGCLWVCAHWPPVGLFMSPTTRGPWPQPWVVHYVRTASCRGCEETPWWYQNICRGVGWGGQKHAVAVLHCHRRMCVSFPPFVKVALT